MIRHVTGRASGTLFPHLCTPRPSVTTHCVSDRWWRQRRWDLPMRRVAAMDFVTHHQQLGRAA